MPGTVPRGPLPYRQEGGFHLIEIRLNRILQLFSSLDPAPFREKDLDADAETYIVGAAAEFHHAQPLKLVLYLPDSELRSTDAAAVGDAVGNYFGYRQWVAAAELRQLLRNGWISLIIGAAFLFVCLSLRQAVTAWDGNAAREILAEGLLISGWVAMWRPLQVFLYDWWPVRRRVRLYGKLQAMPVDVRPAAAAPAGVA